MNEVVDDAHRDNAGKLRNLLSVYKKAEDLINVGAYVEGSNPKIDESLRKIDGIEEFLRQPHKTLVRMDQAVSELEKAVA